MTDPIQHGDPWVVTLQVQRPDGSVIAWVADNAEDEATAMAEADIMRLAYHSATGVFPMLLDEPIVHEPTEEDDAEAEMAEIEAEDAERDAMHDAFANGRWLSVVAFGDAFDGITLIGPFETNEDALAYAEASDNGSDWHVVTLTTAREFDARSFDHGLNQEYAGRKE